MCFLLSVLYYVTFSVSLLSHSVQTTVTEPNNIKIIFTAITQQCNQFGGRATSFYNASERKREHLVFLLWRREGKRICRCLRRLFGCNERVTGEECNFMRLLRARGLKTREHLHLIWLVYISCWTLTVALCITRPHCLLLLWYRS